MSDDIAPLLAKARAARRAGHADVAYANQQAAVALIRAAGDPRLPSALRHVVEMAVEAGLAAQVLPERAEMIALHRGLRDGEPLDLASAVRVVVVHAEALGDTAAAIGHWTEARDRYAQLGVEGGVAEAEAALARLAS